MELNHFWEDFLNYLFLPFFIYLIMRSYLQLTFKLVSKYSVNDPILHVRIHYNKKFITELHKREETVFRVS
jgi:hypothetical protein